MTSGIRCSGLQIDFAPYRLTGTVYGTLLNHRPAWDALAGAMNSAPYKGPPKAPILYVKPRNCIVGHGVLGRLLARISLAVRNDPPTVWEKNPERVGGAVDYGVIDPEHDQRRDYKSIYDVSGDAGLLDSLIGRIAPGGEVVLAGFYSERLSFAFPPAFMREARLRIAAEWLPSDLVAIKTLIESGRLSLDGLITHRRDVQDASDAYRIAFEDSACLKMVLNWSLLS